MSVEYKVYGIEERFQEKEKEYFEAKKEKNLEGFLILSIFPDSKRIK